MDGLLLYAPGDAAPRSLQSGRNLDDVRRRLERSAPRDGALHLLGASALLAASAFALAGAVILGPFWLAPHAPAAAVSSIGL